MASMTTLTGTTTQVDSALDDLAAEIDGELIRTGDADYEQARALWNGMTPRRPGAIVRCAGIDDVRASVRMATAHDLLLAVRGGGHHVAGTASVDGGLVIDLSALRQVDVDVPARRARAGGGATWADVDAATQPHGLAAPGGLVSKTGIGGLTLGGGLGWLRRKHGLACDNLVAATLVAADGTVHQVDEDRDPELLWGLRGGGGNFGVVTELTYQLHPVGPDVHLAFVAYSADRATDVLRTYRNWTADLADEVSSIAMLGAIPAEPDFPQEHWGAPGVILVACASGGLDGGEQLTQPLRDLADPIADLSGPIPYAELQQLFDGDYPDGLRYYWKSVHLPGLPDDVIDLAVEWAGRRPSPHSTVDLWHLGGAMARVPADATAYGDRSDPFLLGVESNWEHADDDDANVAWTRDCVDAFRPHSSGREYLNFPGFLEDGRETLRAAHGDDNYTRLTRLKRRLDPENRFRLHQNIPPA